MNVVKLLEELDLSFHNLALLKQAFTHSSYVNEHRVNNFSDNERLEFLGDAVLELGVSQFLYLNNPTMPEGEMTKLRATIVCEPSLYRFAKELHFGDYVFLGKGEERTGGRDRPALLSDVFEAFLGALYLDQGYEKALQFLNTHVFPKIESGAFSHAMDYKSQLQELVQQDKDQTISYNIIEEKGPSHNREFTSEVIVMEDITATGTGRTKKEAEQRAAKNVLDILLQQK